MYPWIPAARVDQTERAGRPSRFSPSRHGECAAVGESRLDALRTAAATCTDCDLYERATQTVFGEGPSDAALVLVGEQPGDKEDRSGHPFVGPAGTVLDDALRDASIDRTTVYVTNAVKHFKWTARGKVRLHKKPDAREVAACSRWWRAEVEAIRPTGIVCLGATAAAAVIGTQVRVLRDRATFYDHPLAAWCTLTVHPSSVLRADDRATAYAALVDDLRAIKAHLDTTRR
jgi:DNA polymerase